MAKNKQPDGPRLLAERIDQRGKQTKTEIADLCGMTIEQLRHVVAERRRPTLAQAVSIETRLGIPIRAWI